MQNFSDKPHNIFLALVFEISTSSSIILCNLDWEPTRINEDFMEHVAMTYGKKNPVMGMKTDFCDDKSARSAVSVYRRPWVKEHPSFHTERNGDGQGNQVKECPRVLTGVANGLFRFYSCPACFFS